MNILNGTEAFTAMSAGQKIECRHVGSDLDFDDIRNFSATVFVDQDYEFRIAVIYMMIGAMQVPEAVKDTPAKGAQCFSPSLLTAELSKAFKWRNSDSDLVLLERGLVHLYEENAITHSRALIAVSHGSAERLKAETDDYDWLDPLPDQNSTSNDVKEKTFTSQSNIEIVSQGPITAVEDSLTDLNVQAEPAEEVQAKKPTSAELRKEYLVSMNKAKNLEELDLAYRPSVIKGGLTVAHEAYLKSTYLQLKEKFKPAVQPAKEEQQTSVVNEIKSNAIAGGLKTSIQDALNLEVMAEIAQTIRDNKPNLTTDHMAEILQVYGARKTFLENQQDMFEEDTDVTWTDSAIKRIEAAKNQDDINAVYLDPEYDEQSDKDKQRLDIASQKREAELFG